MFLLLLSIATGLFYCRTEISSYLLLRHCIVWSENVKIEYQDFNEEPNKDSEMDMYFWHGITLKSSSFSKAKAIAIFDKNKSWVKDTTKFNFRELLVMQKVAFNLTECYARKFNNEIKNRGYNNDGSQKPYKDLEKIGDSIYDEYQMMEYQMLNDKYRNVTQLIEYWKPKVDKMLEETNNYR
jgi:hypothetical protein